MMKLLMAIPFCRSFPVSRFRSLFCASVACTGWAALIVLAATIRPAISLADEPERPVGVLAPSVDAIAMTDEVKAAVEPLFNSIRDAKTIRTVAEMQLTASIEGKPVQAEGGTYQIISAAPNRVMAVLKRPDQETQLVSDGEQLIFALTPDAYVQAEAPRSLDLVASDVETPFGPFPEYILSLTLAGADSFPAFFRTAAGMGISDGKREELPDTQRVHVRRNDGVVWDLWIRKGDKPAPVRLSVDITGMLLKMNQMNIPEGFRYVMEVEFKTWEVDAEVADEVFTFQPKADAQKFDSIEAFMASLSDTEGPHPLLGQPAPEFTSQLLGGKPFELKQHRGKQAVVLDFWATWCGPCIEALPMISKTAARFADKGVAFYAVNVGEEPARITAFLKEQKLDVSVILDPDGDLANAYGANAIPQTVLIGKDGRVEAVHVGFAGAEAMKKILTEELTTLSKGERLIPQNQPVENAEAPGDVPANQPVEQPSGQ